MSQVAYLILEVSSSPWSDTSEFWRCSAKLSSKFSFKVDFLRSYVHSTMYIRHCGFTGTMYNLKVKLNTAKGHWSAEHRVKSSVNVGPDNIQDGGFARPSSACWAHPSVVDFDKLLGVIIELYGPIRFWDYYKGTKSLAGGPLKSVLLRTASCCHFCTVWISVWYLKGGFLPSKLVCTQHWDQEAAFTFCYQTSCSMCGGSLSYIHFCLCLNLTQVHTELVGDLSSCCPLCWIHCMNNSIKNYCTNHI